MEIVAIDRPRLQHEAAGALLGDRLPRAENGVLAHDVLLDRAPARAMPGDVVVEDVIEDRQVRLVERAAGAGLQAAHDTGRIRMLCHDRLLHSRRQDAACPFPNCAAIIFLASCTFKSAVQAAARASA
jgi:hypothetical protein